MRNLMLIIFLVSTFYACKQVPNEPKESKEKDVFTEENESEWVSLFDGKTFDGWHIYNTKNEVSDEWSIDNSAMFFNPRQGRTEGGKKYGYR